MSANDYQVGGDHYKNMAIQPWDLMELLMSRDEFIGYLKGNVIKYTLRAGHKLNSSDDAQKALHYKQKLEEVIEQMGRDW